jgi:hypothetical protein
MVLMHEAFARELARQLTQERRGQALTARKSRRSRETFRRRLGDRLIAAGSRLCGSAAPTRAIPKVAGGPS